MNLENKYKERYATKLFNKRKKISEEDLKKVYELLQASPSSVNIQPWHFYILDDHNKEKLNAAFEGFEFNKSKLETASHIIVFASKMEIDDDYLEKIVNQEDQNGRFAKEEFKESSKNGRKFFVDLHKYDYKDEKQWLEKQVSLNIGHFALGLKMLGIDSVIMEGFDKAKLDQSLNIRKDGYTSVMVVGMGYGAEDDFNAKLPKSRLLEKDLFTTI